MSTKAIVGRVWSTIDAGHFSSSPNPKNCPGCSARAHAAVIEIGPSTCAMDCESSLRPTSTGVPGTHSAARELTRGHAVRGAAWPAVLFSHWRIAQSRVRELITRNQLGMRPFYTIVTD